MIIVTDGLAFRVLEVLIIGKMVPPLVLRDTVPGVSLLREQVSLMKRAFKLQPVG